MENNNSNMEHKLNDLSGNFRYRILADSNAEIKILDKTNGIISTISPIEIVLTNLHFECSPDDNLRVGFILGQMSN